MKKKASWNRPLVAGILVISIVGLASLFCHTHNSVVSATGWSWTIDRADPVYVGGVLAGINFSLSFPGQKPLRHFVGPTHPEWDRLKNKGAGENLFLNTNQDRKVTLITAD